MPLAAQAEPDTVAVHSIYAGEPLLKLVTGVASLAKGAFRPEDAELIQKQAWEESSSRPDVRNGQVERGYGYGVEGRSQRRAVLAIFLRSSRSYYYDVRIDVADDALMKAIRAHLTELEIDSLIPIDRVRLTFGEGGVAGSPSRLILRTVRGFPCLGYHIDHDLRQTGFDTLVLNLHGVAAPRDTCPGMIGPAMMSRDLSLYPGKYQLFVSYRGRRDRLILDLSDSAASVTGVNSSLVEADERLRWRYPPNSFSLRCGVVERTRALCADALAWVARQRGISRVSFSQGVIKPYTPDPASRPDAGIGLFSYDRVVYFEGLRPCFEAIDDAVRRTVGVSLTLEDWRGISITANSQGSSHDRHIQVPTRVSDFPACPTPSWGPR